MVVAPADGGIGPWHGSTTSSSCSCISAPTCSRSGDSTSSSACRGSPTSPTSSSWPWARTRTRSARSVRRPTSAAFSSTSAASACPWPVALVVAIAAGAVVGAMIGLTGLKRLRQDYQAVAMLVVSLMLATVISADVGIFNGSAGIALIPNPFADQDPEVARWLYVGLVAVCCVHRVLGPAPLHHRSYGPHAAGDARRRHRRVGGGQECRRPAPARAGGGRWLRWPERRAARRLHRWLVAIGVGVHRDARLPQLHHRRRHGQRPRRQRWAR